MSNDRWPRSPLIVFARRMLQMAAVLVPTDRRRDWRQTWEGELWVLGHDPTAGATDVLWFIAGSLPAAVSELCADWSADSLAADVRRGWRHLGSSPGPTALALVVMTVGVGANTAIFTLVNSTLLCAPPHVAEPGRLVRIGGRSGADDFDHLSFPNYTDIRIGSGVFDGLAAYGRATPLAQTPGAALPLTVHAVTTNLFDVLGVGPTIGRFFVPADDAAAVAVISESVWRLQYGARGDIAGQLLLLDGASFTIIGVAPPGFVGADIGGPPPGAWVPLRAFDVFCEQIASLDERGHSWLRVVGRLAPGVSFEHAREQLEALHASLAGRSPVHKGTLGRRLAIVRGVGLNPDERVEAERVSSLLMAIVGAVLLIACANLAGILAAQTARRQRELGICAAVGASTIRLTRELIAEQLTVAVVGAAAAWAATRWTAAAVQALLPYSLSVTLAPDWRVFVFAMTAATLTALAFGIVPARRGARVDVIVSLGGPGSARHGQGPSAWLATAQLAIAFTLLIGAALFIRSVMYAQSVDPGFTVDGVTAVQLKLDLVRDQGEAAATRVLDALLTEVRRMHGVRSVALATHPPLAAPQRTRSIRIAGAAWEDEPGTAAVNAVSPEFFRALQMPVRLGRTFATHDCLADAAPTAVISESMARRLWPDGNAIGQRIDVGTAAEVIGVVGDVKLRTLADRNAAAVYLPLRGSTEADVTLLVRTQHQDAAALMTTLRAVAPEAVAVANGPLRMMIGRTYAESRMMATLLLVFSGVAALLAAAGVYGVLAFWVSHRRSELALRLALGATRRDLASLVLRRAVPTVLGGLAAGAALAMLATRALQSLLFGIAPFDPVSYAVSGFLLVVISGVAAFAPAYQAMRANPMVTLKGV